ncbi:MAG: glycosyltransferase family 2 protein [Pedobacter sp.]|nr:MAG: glycosyltransferase family 2 protein [Pedobacter sp.]
MFFNQKGHSMKNLPLISICVCTYNGDKYLEEQLKSLINQDYPNFEIVIVDDRSTDTTYQILERFAAEHTNIHIYQNPNNLGYIKNFEKAISLSNGDLITLCDQDDLWESNKLSILFSRFDSSSILIYHNSNLIDEKNSFLNKTLAQSIGYINGNNHVALFLNNCVAGHAMMFRKDLVLKILPFPENIPHDHWIAYVALHNGYLQFLDLCLVNYRQHNFSVTYTHHLEKKQTSIFEDKLEKRREIKNLRIKHLHTLLKYPLNTEADVIIIQNLIRYLSARDDHYFSFSMFFYFLRHQKRLFELYHKSFLSNASLIYKECIGQKAKVFWNNIGL